MLYPDSTFSAGIVQPMPAELVADYPHGKKDAAPEVPLCAPCTALPITVRVAAKPAAPADSGVATGPAPASAKKPLSPRAKAAAAQAVEVQGATCIHEATRPVHVRLHSGWPSSEGTLKAGSAVEEPCLRAQVGSIDSNCLHELFGSFAAERGFPETDSAYCAPAAAHDQPASDTETVHHALCTDSESHQAIMQQGAELVLQARAGVAELAEFQVGVQGDRGSCALQTGQYTLVFESEAVSPAYVPVAVVTAKQGK